MIKLLYEGILNRLDQNWLLFIQTLLFKPDYEWTDGFTHHVRLWTHKQIIEFYSEENGSIVWRVDYKPHEKYLRMYCGATMEVIIYKSSPSSGHMEIFDKLEEYTRSSVEKILLE